MNKIGLLAGNRRFPLLFAAKAKEKSPNLEIVTVAIKGETNPKISQYSHKVYWADICQLQSIIDIFLAEGIDKVILAGQISPYRIFKGRNKWDLLMQNISQRISDFRPHSVFSEIINQAEKQGLEFLSSLTYMEDYVASPGINNNIQINEHIKEEVGKSVVLTRSIVDLDIGQTVVFKDKAIVAVEALEGTDNTIKRATRIAGKGLLVIKLAKQDQDLRFDIPIIGIATLKLLAKSRAKALVLNANKTLILDKPEVILFADKKGIPIIGI
jgi:UDP-2,3-diacylglucosamine hydrolase